MQNVNFYKKFNIHRMVTESHLPAKGTKAKYSIIEFIIRTTETFPKRPALSPPQQFGRAALLQSYLMFSYSHTSFYCTSQMLHFLQMETLSRPCVESSVGIILLTLCLYVHLLTLCLYVTLW